MIHIRWSSIPVSRCSDPCNAHLWYRSIRSWKRPSTKDWQVEETQRSVLDYRKAVVPQKLFSECPPVVVQGWGYSSNFLLLIIFSKFSAYSKHALAMEYHLHIWQLSPQPSSQYICDSNNLRSTLARSMILHTAKLTNGDLVSPTPCWLRSYTL